MSIGTCGGMWGRERGYGMMMGDRDVIDYFDPIFKALAPGKAISDDYPRRAHWDPRVQRGYVHCGSSGAGRFVKMIDNVVEYGMIAAYAEGFEILRRSAGETVREVRRYALDRSDIAEAGRRGRVIGSWLPDLTAMALAEAPALTGYSGFVEALGDGPWTIMAAIEETVPANALSAVLYVRFRSREKDSLADKLLSGMRHESGGHDEPKGDG
jgi:6-phosphogluconate dehydrogenase